MAKLVAHRGASAQATENTIAAFELAIKLGADFIEFDVLRTRDGVLIVHHDQELDGRPIHEIDYETIVGSPRYKHIPTLAQTLEQVAGRIKLYVEVKVPGTELEVVDMVQSYVYNSEFVIISFEDEIIASVKEYAASVKTGLILVHKNSQTGKLIIRWQDIFHISRIRNTRADMIAPRCTPALMTSLAYAYILNIPLYIWVVDNPALFRLISRLKKVETIASNIPPDMTPDKLHKKTDHHRVNHFFHPLTG